jgi:hypothetical protein
MTARLAETQLWQQNLASLIRSGLFARAAKGRGERLIHRRRDLRGPGAFGAPGQVLELEAGCRRRQPGQSDRPGARAGRVELIGVTAPGSFPTMVARGMGESAMVFCPRFRWGIAPERSRDPVEPFDPLIREAWYAGGAPEA